MTRNRNIKEVHFYFNNVHNELKFRSIDDVKEYYDDFQSHYESILNEYGYFTMNDEFKITYNTTKFTKLFYSHKYSENILRSNYIYHFMQTCKSKGMIVNIIDSDYNKLNDKQAKADAKARKIELIDNVLENKIESSPIYQAIVKRSAMCHITIDEMSNNEAFKEIITNDRSFTNHLNINKMVCKVAEQDADVNNKYQSDFQEHVLTSTTSKIQFINRLQTILGVESFDIDYDKHHDKYNDAIKLDESICKLYKKVFSDSSKKTECITWYDGYKILINCYKNLFGSEIITTEIENKRINKKFVRTLKHNINTALITEHLNLILHRRESYDINERICEKYNIEVKPLTPVYIF